MACTEFDCRVIVFALADGDKIEEHLDAKVEIT